MDQSEIWTWFPELQEINRAIKRALVDVKGAVGLQVLIGI